MKTQTTATEEAAALAILKSTGVPVLEAAWLAKEALAAGRGRVKRARRCLAEGEKALSLKEKTVSFAKAVEAALEARKDRRPRTRCDFRYITRRLMKRNPGLAARRMRSITAEDCRHILKTAFDTPQQYRKGRAVLSGVFSTAFRRGWCDENPVRRIEVPTVHETPIRPLSLEEVERLRRTAQRPEHRDMELPLHLMLYCGIRPTEVQRLRPEDIDWKHRQVIIRPQTSKTGGGRVVPLRIRRNINRALPRRSTWERRWQHLRRSAGFTRWVPDVCRHTFASYHAAHFRNLPALQLEMGHRDSGLLRSRYVGATAWNEVKAFWVSNNE